MVDMVETGKTLFSKSIYSGTGCNKISLGQTNLHDTERTCFTVSDLLWGPFIWPAVLIKYPSTIVPFRFGFYIVSLFVIYLEFYFCWRFYFYKKLIWLFVDPRLFVDGYTECSRVLQNLIRYLDYHRLWCLNRQIDNVLLPSTIVATTI